MMTGLLSVVCRPRGVQFPGTVYICSQDPLSNAWAHCTSCAHSACSHCRRCRYCPTAHGNSPELCSRSRPVPQIIIFVFPAFTLSFLFHCFFPSQEPPDTFLERVSDDNKIISIVGTPERNSRDKASSTIMKSSGLAEYWSLVNTDLHFKLFTVPLTNMDTAPRICIHPLHQSHNPLLHTRFSQCPPDDLLKYSIKRFLQVQESHV